MKWQDDVIEGIGAPERTAAFGDDVWQQAEKEIGCAYPSDFQDIVDRIGAGRLGDFLLLPAPGHANTNLNLSDVARHALFSYASLHDVDGGGLQRPSAPETEGILPFFVTDNADYLSSLIDGTNPNEWPVCLFHEGRTSEEIVGLGFKDFLQALLAGRIKSRLLPAGFLEGPKTFQALP